METLENRILHGRKVLEDFEQLKRDPKRFEKLDDVWVRDYLYGIDRGRSAYMVISDMPKYCADQGGRMPTIEEELGLVDYSKRPALFCPELFDDTNFDSWYATSTEVPGVPGYVRIVDYKSGFVSFVHKDFEHYVRPVRPSQC